MASLLARMSLFLVFMSSLFIGAALLAGTQLEAEIISAAVNNNFGFDHFLVIDIARQLNIPLISPVENTSDVLLSPNGRGVVIYAQTLDNEAARDQLYYYNIQTGFLRQLMDFELEQDFSGNFSIGGLYVYIPSWSPDGQRFAFINIYSQELNLVELPNFTQEIVDNWFSGKVPDFLLWSPDSTQFTFARNSLLTVINAEEGVVNQFNISEDALPSTHYPRWSEDSTKLVLSFYAGNLRSEFPGLIRVFNADNGSVNRFTARLAGRYGEISAGWINWCGEEKLFYATSRSLLDKHILDLNTGINVDLDNLLADANLPPDYTLRLIGQQCNWLVIYGLARSDAGYEIFLYNITSQALSQLTPLGYTTEFFEDGFLYEELLPGGNVAVYRVRLSQTVDVTKITEIRGHPYWLDWSTHLNRAIGLSTYSGRIFVLDTVTSEIHYITSKDDLIYQAALWR